MQQFKRQTTAGNRTIPSTPSRWQKFTDFKRNLGEWEAEKIHKQQALRTLRFIADFPIWQSCQPTAVPWGNYLQKPRGLSHCASSDDVTTDLCAAACCSQNSWEQSPSCLILKSRQDLGSDVVWYNLLSAFNNNKKIKWEHPVGNAAFPEFSSLCKKLLLRGFCTRPMAWDSTVFSFTTSIRNFVLWGKGS